MLPKAINFEMGWKLETRHESRITFELTGSE